MQRNLACKAFPIFVFLVAARTGLPHDVITTKLTWNREISRIVYKRCVSCHRAGGSAMSLVTYEEARPWAKAIRDQVTARSMPPWGAVKGAGAFRNEPSLTEVEIQMLVAWVEGGAPKGDNDALAPKLPSIVEPKAAATVRLAATGEMRLSHPIVVIGLRPESLDDGRSMLVDAWLPDGRVEHLIWLRDYHRQWTRDYLFRNAITLPAGTVVHVKAEAPAKAQLLVKAGSQAR